MKKTSLLVRLLQLGGLLGVLAGGYGLYLWNLPHRDVRAARIDYQVTARQLVEEYLANRTAADAKYLVEGGDSKILAITGTVRKLSTNQNGETVVVLREAEAKAGVSCTFTAATNAQAAALKPGDTVTIKGVIRAGAEYSEILELYVDAVVEKCSI